MLLRELPARRLHNKTNRRLSNLGLAPLILHEGRRSTATTGYARANATTCNRVACTSMKCRWTRRPWLAWAFERFRAGIGSNGLPLQHLLERRGKIMSIALGGHLDQRLRPQTFSRTLLVLYLLLQRTLRPPICGKYMYFHPCCRLRP